MSKLLRFSFVALLAALLALALNDTPAPAWPGQGWSSSGGGTSGGGGSGGSGALNCTLINSFTGIYPNALTSTGSIANTSKNLTNTGGTTFSSGDVGKTIIVANAGGVNTPLVTTIATFTDSTHVVLTAAASATVTSQGIAWGTDNSAGVQSAVNAAAGQYTLCFQGKYLFTSGVSIPSNTHLMGVGSATLIGALGSGSGVNTSNCMLLGLTALGTTEALSSNVAEGALSMTFAGTTVSVGQGLVVSDGVYGQRFTAIATSGAGPQTVTLDRPTLYPYTAGTETVQAITTDVQNVEIDHLTFAGYSGAVMLEFFGGATHILEHDLTFDGTIAGSPAGLWQDFDLYDYDCEADRFVFKQVLGDGAGVDTAENIRFHGYSYTNQGTSPPSLTAGWETNNSPAVSLEGFDISGGYYGIWLYQQAPPTTLGNKSVTVRDGLVGGSQNIGINVQTTVDTLLERVNVEGTAANATGIDVTSSAVNTHIIDAHVRYNGDTGIVVNAGAIGTVIEGGELTQNTKDGTTGAQELYLAANAIIRQVQFNPATVNNASVIVVQDTGGSGTINNLLFDGITGARGADNGAFINAFGTNPSFRVINSTIGAGTSSGNGIVTLNAATVNIKNTTLTGTGGTGLAVGAGTTAQVDQGFLDTASTPISNSGTVTSLLSFANLGSWSFNAFSGTKDQQLGTVPANGLWLKTTDTTTHTFSLTVTSGHVNHITIDWNCVWTGTPANADGGRFDATCTNSSGTVTCAQTVGSHQSLGTEGCNAPTVTAGSGVGSLNVSASNTAAIDWQVLVTFNNN